tara:strand:+ start:1458 stop:2807 length:1350 start_codon:yes stop_codon:yes gene_type:complete
MVRPSMALVAVSAVCFLVYTQATSLVENRLSQPASPVLVASDTWPYQQRTMAFGPQTALSDATYFETLRDELVHTQPQLLTVDVGASKAELYQSGQLVWAAPVTELASTESWRHVPAGYYAVSAVRSERYSSLAQAYYTDVVEFNERLALHGPAQKNDGTPAMAASLGLALGASDAAALAALVASGTPVLVHTPENTVTAGALTPRGPQLAVRSYLVKDLSSDETLAAYNADLVAPIASLTKLMTALVVAEEFDLEGEVPVIAEQHATTLVPRLSGIHRTTVFDLLQLLLLESSNEAAEVLATQMGREQFIAAMNDRATALGLSATTFTDPSGLDDGNQSSARDIYTLTQYLERNYPFLLHVSAREQAVEATREHDFSDLDNFNGIAGLETFVGGKIGETEAAKQTSLTVHEIDFGGGARPVAIVVLGSDSRSADVTALHNYALERYRN